MAGAFRYKFDVNARYTISAINILPGERFQVYYVVLDDCGKELDKMPFKQNCCPVYVGDCEAGDVGTGNPVNINTFMGYESPGVYEFVPDGVVGSKAAIHVKRWSETI